MAKPPFPALPRTRIVATLGPASRDSAVLRGLLEAGASVFRFNFSHGAVEGHAAALAALRAAAGGQAVATLADLQGPKIRTGRTPNDESVTLEAGSEIDLIAGAGPCDSRTVSISYANLFREIRVGQTLLIHDGAIRLRVTATDPARGRGRAKVLNSGSYSSRKGVNLPGARLRIPALTAKDRRDLEFILANGFDYVALSFVRSAADLAPLRRRLARAPDAPRIIAKIETPEAVADIEAILDGCDGIMVARGDLGVEVEPERVPMIQKALIAAANRRGKTVIVATQMLESMIAAPRPTRAEASDVANAILDGTDAVMLSGETSVGRHPVAAVQMMAAIDAQVANAERADWEMLDLCLPEKRLFHSLCESAVWASRDLGHAPIVVFTLSGDTALYLSKLRPAAPIWAFTPDPRAARRLALAWHTRTFPAPRVRNEETLAAVAKRRLRTEGLTRRGATLVVLGGITPTPGQSNTLRIVRVDG